MNKVLIECVERHIYAPELNKIWFTDGSSISAPGVTTLEEAKKFITKG